VVSQQLWWAASKASFDGDHIGAGGPDVDRGGQTGEDIVVTYVPVQQQYVDQFPGARGITMRLAGGAPERLMRAREGASRAGLHQRRRPRQGTWLIFRTSR
jgi:hypothetical protein